MLVFYDAQVFAKIPDLEDTAVKVKQYINLRSWALVSCNIGPQSYAYYLYTHSTHIHIHKYMCIYVHFYVYV